MPRTLGATGAPSSATPSSDLVEALSRPGAWIDLHEFCEITGIPLRTAQKLVASGKCPTIHRLPTKRVRFRRDEVVAWMLGLAA